MKNAGRKLSSVPNKKDTEVSKISGKSSWIERRDHIMSIIDKYGRIVHAYHSDSILRKNLYSWMGMPVSEKDFERLAKMGWIRQESGMRRKFWVRNIPKPVTVEKEPSEPFKKRKAALKEFYEANPTLKR